MGGAQSSFSNQVASAVNSALNDVVNQATDLSTQDCVSNQSVTINCGVAPYCDCSQFAPGSCCTIQHDAFIQTATQSCSLNSSAVQSVSSSAAASLSTAVSQTVQQQQSMVLGWLGTGLGGQFQKSSSVSDVANYLSNIVQNINYSDAINNTVSTQAQVINLCGTYINNTNSNNLQQNALVSNTTNLVMNALNNDTVFNSLSQYASQHQFLQIQGLTLGGFIGMVVGVVLLLIVVAVFWHWMRKRRYPSVQKKTSSTSVVAPKKPPVVPTSAPSTTSSGSVA